MDCNTLICITFLNIITYKNFVNNIKTIKHLINNYGFFNLFKKGFIFYKRKYIRSPQTLSSGYANSLGQVKKWPFKFKME